MSKDGFDTAVRSFGDVNKSFQAITSEITDYSKKAFEELTRAFEHSRAKSIPQAIEILIYVCQDCLRGLCGPDFEVGRDVCRSGQGRLQAGRGHRC